MDDLGNVNPPQPGTNSWRKKLDFLMKQSPMICFEITLDGIILFVSPTIQSVSGYSDRELLNRSMWNLYADMNAREQLMDTLLQQGQLRDYHITLKDKMDRLRQCRVDAILICSETGEPVSLFGTFMALD